MSNAIKELAVKTLFAAEETCGVLTVSDPKSGAVLYTGNPAIQMYRQYVNAYAKTLKDRDPQEVLQEYKQEQIKQAQAQQIKQDQAPSPSPTSKAIVKRKLVEPVSPGVESIKLDQPVPEQAPPAPAPVFKPEVPAFEFAPTATPAKPKTQREPIVVSRARSAEVGNRALGATDAGSEEADEGESEF